MSNQPSDRDVWQLIQAFDRDRDRDILAIKYAKMRQSALAFFRGTCHLFYRDLPSSLTTLAAPVVWICGDLHLENFGTYKGDDRQIYFGVNDFDEGALAPFTWDVTRLLTSIWLAATDLKFDSVAAQKLVRSYLNRYIDTIVKGIEAIDEDNADGIVAALIKDLRRRKRKDFLDERTKSIEGQRQLICDGKKILTVSDSTTRRVRQLVEDWAQSQPNPSFFEVIDIGFRIAGTGSLGVERYLILVVGEGSPDRNYLLDLKYQPISALQFYAKDRSQWQEQALRVIQIQQLVQPAPPALMAAIATADRSYLLRELQPTQDKIALKAGKINLAQMEQLLDPMARVTASVHLHGSDRSGAASAQDLVAFVRDPNWTKQLSNYAAEYAVRVRSDYQKFCDVSQDRSVAN